MKSLQMSFIFTNIIISCSYQRLVISPSSVDNNRFWHSYSLSFPLPCVQSSSFALSFLSLGLALSLFLSPSLSLSHSYHPSPFTIPAQISMSHNKKGELCIITTSTAFAPESHCVFFHLSPIKPSLISCLLLHNCETSQIRWVLSLPWIIRYEILKIWYDILEISTFHMS